ncbi:oligosaccharide flippase family protein [Vibrio breoganii]|uniref:oligosaccharide flippase family protein n=1 Tax=Vibrio breoganii TaxID=553239 RepID=UPI000300879A|nr:oligosaccharide flippase family protein [Vibrio breoganii]OED98591.1 hypothetical protein A1QE_00985 [Vibrio breoganii ZF-55]
MISKNIAYNLTGKLTTSIIAFLVVPVYINYVGKEPYAIIGVLTTIQAIFILLDSGMSAGFLRQVAYLNAKKEHQKITNITACMELIFFIFSAIVFIVLFSSSDYIANNWLNLSDDFIQEGLRSIEFIAVIVALNFMALIYQASLKGSQKFGVANLINVGGAVSKFIFSIILLEYYQNSINSIMKGYALVSVLQLICLRLYTRPFTRDAYTDWSDGIKQILSIKKFIGGMAFISLTSALLAQIDKVILSKIVPLEEFSYYTIAALFASIPLTISAPVAGAIYPSFIAYLAEDKRKINDFYHSCASFLSILIYPIACILYFYSFDLIFLWTNDITLSENTYRIAKILIIGSAILSIMSMPYFLSLALGKTKIALSTNILAIILSIPLMYLLTSEYGAVGGAFGWLFINLLFLTVFVGLLHRSSLRYEKSRWYISDNLLYLVSSSIVVRMSCEIGTTEFSIIGKLLFLSFIWFLSVSFCIILSPYRAKVIKFITGFSK